MNPYPGIMRRYPSTGWLRAVLLLLAGLSCAEPTRENLVDPVAAPTLEAGEVSVDGGSIVIEWRYADEGGAIEAFVVERIVREQTIPIERMPASSAPRAEFQSISFRDSTVVSGVRVRYRVTAILSSGSPGPSVVTSSILIEGSAFDPPISDPDRVLIELSWREVPPDAAGFDVFRQFGEEQEELVFSTDDPTVGSFEDTDLVGNRAYAYRLVTRLQGGGTLVSEARTASLFKERFSYNLDLAGAVRTFVTRGVDRGGFEPTVRVVRISEQDARYAVVINSPSGSGNPAESAEGLTFAPWLGDYDPRSVNVAGGSLAQFEEDQRHLFVSGLDASGSGLFLAVYGRTDSAYWPFDTDTLLTWPSSGAGRTGVALFAHKHTILYGGSVLRELGPDLEVLETLDTGLEEPIDIEYVGGTVWLAYEDRLLRSNEVTSLGEIVSWSEVGLSEPGTITAITRFRDRLLILDGSNAKVQLADLDGRIRLSWDALGRDLSGGDIAASGKDQWVYQSDGTGQVYFFIPEGGD